MGEMFGFWLSIGNEKASLIEKPAFSSPRKTKGNTKSLYNALS